jgi:hypothetical protein
MSWLFSQALVAEYSEATCSDGEPFAPSSGNPTPQAYSSPDRMTVFSRLSRFGMTFAPLTDARGEELLTWFRAGFPAKTSAPLERARESKASDPACGARWPASLAKFDPATSSWRTPQCSLFEDLEQSLETWPRWGSMRNGECWERQTWERRTSEIESGLLPTPLSTLGTNGGPNQRDSSGRPGLQMAARYWPTPQASESAAGTPKGKMQKMLGNHPMIRGTSQQEWECGTLNPTWVEWLMGWPLGWTDLKPLATDKSRNALPRRGVG